MMALMLIGEAGILSRRALLSAAVQSLMISSRSFTMHCITISRIICRNLSSI